jgi:aldehyde:ferredoxin oxidoreductase
MTNVLEMKKAHKVLARMDYVPSPAKKGYTNNTLYVNLSDNSIKSKPVTQQMKDLFIGGKGFGLWLLWNGVNENTKWDSPENEIVISSGPLGGTSSFPGAGKSLVVSISPTTGSIIDSNVGGHFGPLLKFAGWDAIELQGKADKDIIVFIDAINKRVTIEEAPLEAVDAHVVSEQFTEMYADSEEEKQNISVVSAGVGSDHVLIGCLNFSWWDWRRQGTRIKQAGRGGIGSVFRNKKIKALIVKTSNMRPKWTIQQRQPEPVKGV